jgi:NTE family protein
MSLAGGGVDLAQADFIIGTSAGSSVGAQIALGRSLEDAVEKYRATATNRAARDERSAAGPAMGERFQKLIEMMAKVYTSDAPPEETRAEIGKFALEAVTAPEEQFIAGFRHLSGDGWPRRYACTAVDAVTGEFVVWDGDSGVEVERAVASSCAVPGIFPPITIKGRRYIDGGMRSGTNADLATGHDRVLLVTLIGGSRAVVESRFARMRERREQEMTSLRDAGAQIETLEPDDETAALIGFNLMDSSLVFDAVEAGIRQGKVEADRLRAFWR